MSNAVATKVVPINNNFLELNKSSHEALKNTNNQHNVVSMENRNSLEKKRKSNVHFEEQTHVDMLLASRVYSAYTKGRKDPREDYEPSISDREWWRAYVKETPGAGHYNFHDFLHEGRMNPIQATYNFAGQGRKHEPGISRKGNLLLPGLYKYSNFVDELHQRTKTYSFKSSGRSRTPSGFQDKDLNVPPWQYNTIAKPSKKEKDHPTLTSSFRSQSTRFPSSNFKAREGPPPGAYNPANQKTKYAISSSFRSGTARFSTSHTKVPGPGTYESTTGQGVSKDKKSPSTLTKMGQMHGLYFRNTFET